MALVLFDIDGTLLRRSGPHHRQALEDAVRAITGVSATTEGIPVAGMLDGDILMQMMANSGLKVSAARRALRPVMTKAESLYVRRCPDLRGRVCPGVRGLLGRLSRRKIVTGLVTGNLMRIAWTKMRRAGLAEFFRFGAFADMGRTRAELAGIARRTAVQQGWISRTTPVILVGDHPNDVMAARSSGARSVAVGTGVVGMDELATHEPDHLIEDLRRFDVAWLTMSKGN